MGEDKKEYNPLAERIKKLKKYSEAPEKIYWGGPDSDKESFQHYIDDINLKLNVLINEFDTLVGIVHAVAKKNDDQLLRSISDSLKKNKN